MALHRINTVKIGDNYRNEYVVLDEYGRFLGHTWPEATDITHTTCYWPAVSVTGEQAPHWTDVGYFEEPEEAEAWLMERNPWASDSFGNPLAATCGMNKPCENAREVSPGLWWIPSASAENGGWFLLGEGDRAISVHLLNGEVTLSTNVKMMHLTAQEVSNLRFVLNLKLLGAPATNDAEEAMARR